jgi:dTDP-4-amino-4,6-dideoxygalactose transaminase
MVGEQRDVSVFSFHPVKTITSGEGGMIVTDDEFIAERARSLRSFDMNYSPEGHEDEPWYQVVEGLGYNYNITDIQAKLGMIQLNRINEFKNRRKEIVAQYNQALGDILGIRIPVVKNEVDPAWHLYAVEVTNSFGCSRKQFVKAMRAENIGVQVHYVPLHFHPYFAEEHGYEPGDFPNTESIYEGLVSLPLSPAMTDKDVDDVIFAIKRLAEYSLTKPFFFDSSEG